VESSMKKSQGINQVKSGKPTPKEVKEFHDNDDKDAGRNAHHHTLGFGPNQAAPGGDTKKLFDELKLSDDQQNTLLEFLDDRIPRIGDIVLSARVDFTEATGGTDVWKPCIGVGVTLDNTDGDYDEYEDITGGLNVPDLTDLISDYTPGGPTSAWVRLI
jgi:hypothetical protein